MSLQNFLAFLQLEKCPTITHCYIVEVEIVLEVSNKTKRNRKSVWQHQFKQNKVVNSFDCINFRKMMLETALTASIQTKWSGKLRRKVRSKHFEGVKPFYKESRCWVKLMLYCQKKHDYLSFERPFIRSLIAALHDGLHCFLSRKGERAQKRK